MLTSLLLAAVLSEPLVVCQTQFYPTREQDRGYLGRYPDLPLLVIPDLPPAEREIKSTRSRSLWGDYTSMADIDFMYETGRSYGLNGFAFFPVLHRSDLWNAQFTSVPDMKLVPIISFNTALGANKSLDREIEQLGRSLDNQRQATVNGKTLVLSYWCDRANTPEQLKAKLDAARAKVGDRFAFMTAVSWETGLFEYRRTGKMTPAMAERLVEKWRGYLRVSDGILLDGTMSNHAITNSTRVFCDGWHRAVCRLARQVVDEPEFKDKKLLGFTLSLGHQNAYLQSFTANAQGTRTLRQSFANVVEAKPDVILIPEWDECNESTSWKPTLCNGYTTKRLYRYYDAILRGRAQTVMEGDDTSKPNLMISYRRLCSPGEWLYFEVLNVPDGAREGSVEVSIELTDEKGKTIAELPPKTLDEGRLDEAWWDVSSDELARHARAVGVRLSWRKSFFRRGTVEEGLVPINLAPGNSWCLKDVKQALRDLAPVDETSFELKDGKLVAEVACDEPILHAMVLGNGWVQYIHNPESPVSRFREDDDHAVFALDAFWPFSADTRQKGFSFAVPGVPSAEWLCVNEVVTGETFRTDFFSRSGNPVYLRVPKSAVADLKVKADFAPHYVGELDLSVADRLGAVADGAPCGVSFAAVKFDLQPRYPAPLRKKSFSFEVRPAADRRSMTYHLQLVTVSGKTWRSHPIVVEPEEPSVRTCVWSALKQQAVDCRLPASRVPRLVYDFSPAAGDVIRVTSGERRFFGLLGGPQSLVTRWNRGSDADSGPMSYAAILKNDKSTADLRPKREKSADGQWALVFDGVDDYVAFPHETLPQWAGSVTSLEIYPNPAGAERVETVFASRSSIRAGLYDFILDKGEAVVRITHLDAKDSTKVREIRTGLRLAPGTWHKVKVVNDCRTLTVSVDGRAFSEAVPMPGTFMNPVVLGGAVKNKTSFFTGKLRNLTIDQAVAR